MYIVVLNNSQHTTRTYLRVHVSARNDELLVVVSELRPTVTSRKVRIPLFHVTSLPSWLGFHAHISPDYMAIVNSLFVRVG